MATRRFEAVKEAMKRTPVEFNATDKQISTYYGSHVFGYDNMKEYLSEEAFNSVNDAIEKGTSIDRKMAEQVAACMKAWATTHGVTHYTHWFQPLTGTTAEKHDGFLNQ